VDAFVIDNTDDQFSSKQICLKVVFKTWLP